jgi:aminopeptidase
MEVTVEDAWFRFDKGRVVEHGARSGADILERFLHIDRGASFVGEIALVDIDSPIFRSGLQFNSILYDENALTHLALGNGFPACFRDGTQLTTEERKRRAGCNVSLVHTDFMIGSDTLCVSGYDRGGRRYEIVDHGHFCF